jgi:predicted Zn finger-like uncharacterized protein
MIITCECKKYRFLVRAEDIGKNGRLVQCGMCDKKWFQEPANSQEFKTLKDNYIEETKKEEEIKTPEPTKEKPKKNYVPIKYQKKFEFNFTKILLTIIVIGAIVITICLENKEYILSKSPELINLFNLAQEFGEYLKTYYSDIMKIFFQKEITN